MEANAEAIFDCHSILSTNSEQLKSSTPR